MAGKAQAGRVTGAQREALTASLVEQYAAGASIRELASSTGRSYGFIHRVLTDGGAQMRGRGGATRNRAGRLAAS